MNKNDPHMVREDSTDTIKSVHETEYLKTNKLTYHLDSLSNNPLYLICL